MIELCNNIAPPAYTGRLVSSSARCFITLLSTRHSSLGFSSIILRHAKKGRTNKRQEKKKKKMIFTKKTKTKNDFYHNKKDFYHQVHDKQVSPHSPDPTGPGLALYLFIIPRQVSTAHGSSYDYLQHLIVS